MRTRGTDLATRRKQLGDLGREDGSGIEREKKDYGSPGRTRGSRARIQEGGRRLCLQAKKGGMPGVSDMLR